MSRFFEEVDYIQFKANMAKAGMTIRLMDAVNRNDGVDRARLMVMAIIDDCRRIFGKGYHVNQPEISIDGVVFKSDLFHAAPGKFMEFMRRLVGAGLDVRLMYQVNSLPDLLPGLMVQALKKDPYVLESEREAALWKDAEEMSMSDWCSRGSDGGRYLSPEECYQKLKEQRGL